MFVAYKLLYDNYEQLKIYTHAQKVAQLAKAQLEKRLFKESGYRLTIYLPGPLPKHRSGLCSLYFIKHQSEDKNSLTEL
ncbi:hypothetical protein DXT99_24615 [Pontibacter diazotrophicus]|uniref:Uncharacterized protein n=1 Tax=Pontibacter diazotrophicus TaxID=1400979 RepID=A0A3D8L261_9BACT|nr:hypothetical protein DXT99_24615 [Pontibacter diazotrophicus]